MSITDQPPEGKANVAARKNTSDCSFATIILLTSPIMEPLAESCFLSYSHGCVPPFFEVVHHFISMVHCFVDLGKLFLATDVGRKQTKGANVHFPSDVNIF